MARVGHSESLRLDVSGADREKVAAALDNFDPLLVELVRSNALTPMLRDEGFTEFEISAVRALVERERAQSAAPAKEDTRAAVTASSG